MGKGNGKAETSEPTFDTETLRGDIRDAILTEFKQLPKPWQQMNEDEQERVITRATDIAGKVVVGAVDLVAARGLPALPISIAKFEVDGAELKGRYTAYATDENLLRIRHLADRRAMFVMADPEEYLGEKKPAETEVVGDLAMPKTGPGSPSDPKALEKIGRGADA